MTAQAVARRMAQCCRQLAERVGLVRDAKGANTAERSGVKMAGGKRERIDTTPGKTGGSRFVRREAGGRFSSGQTSAGRAREASRDPIERKNAAAITQCCAGSRSGSPAPMNRNDRASLTYENGG